MYQNEGNTQRANLEMLIALENGDYAKYADLLAQWNTDRNFNYGAYRDSISDSRYDNEWDYSVGRDQISDKRYEDETAYDRGLTKAQLLAQMGDFSGYKELGYSDDEVKRLQSAYEQALAQSNTKKRSSGGNKTGYGGGDYESLFAAAKESGYPQSFIANNYRKFGFSSSTGLYGEYSTWAETGNVTLSENGERALTAALNMWNSGYDGDKIDHYLDTRVKQGVITEEEAEKIAAQLFGG